MFLQDAEAEVEGAAQVGAKPRGGAIEMVVPANEGHREAKH